jgi:hypothetical protein
MGRGEHAGRPPSESTHRANIDIFFSAVEQKAEEMDADDETKEVARGRLRRVREALVNMSTGAAGELIATAVRNLLGMG